MGDGGASGVDVLGVTPQTGAAVDQIACRDCPNGSLVTRRIAPSRTPRTVVDCIEAGSFSAADNACKDLIRKRSGAKTINSKELAARIPADLLKQMDQLWRRATGGGRRSRTWVVTNSDITTTAFVNTYLEKRLKQTGL